LCLAKPTKYLTFEPTATMTLKQNFLFLLFLLSLQGVAQQYSPLGHHFITNTTAKQYKLNPQNFGVCQDNRGIMYFANDGGVLEYDGETWRTIKVPTQRTYAIQKSATGIIYVGALNDFGVLVSDNKQGLEFKSLATQLQNEKIPTIRKVLVNDGWIYFIPDPDITANFLFAYNEKENKTYKVVTPFPMSLARTIGNKTIIQVTNGALYTLSKRDIVAVGDAEAWKKVEIKEVFEIDKTVYAFNGKDIYIIPADFSAPVSQTQIIVPSQSHSFLTYKNLFVYAAAKGIHVCDKKGKLIYPLNKQGSLVDNNVRELYIDNNSNLWAATENGISVVDFSNTLTYFNFTDGIDGTVEYITKNKRDLFIESRSGLYKLKNQIPLTEINAFERFSAITNAPYGLTNFVDGNDTSLFIADFEGILKFKGNNNFDRIINCSPWNVHQYNKYPNVLLVPDYTQGLFFLVKQGSSFVTVTIPGIENKSGRQVFEDDNGVLWLSEETNGIFRIEVLRNQSGKFSFKVDFFDQKNGLPDGFSFAFNFDNTTYFGTEKGFYRFDGKTFLPSKLLTLDFAKEYTIHRAKTDPKGNLWVSAYDVNNIKKYFFGFITKKGNKIVRTSQPFLKISDEKIDCIYHENENITWLGGPEGLFRYSKENAENLNRKYQILLRKFSLGTDSLIYNGFGKYDESSFVFPFAQQHFYFEFSGTHYKTENGIRYSYYLEGLDKAWTSATTTNYIEYNNLYEGKYILHVKSTDDFGNSSKEFTLNFTIKPPFYRTTLAYICYAIVFILIIIGAVRISSNGLKKIIAQRTREIEEQKHILEEKNKEIIDSISYAKRLQQAILPDNKTISEVLPNSFVLYKPKDIIAGDFFWMERVGRSVLFAVCDCTGHGVPGAMVSVVGANSLNRCVKEFNLTQPALILDRLTNLVEETFSHSDNEVKDGMDVSLCALNLDTLEMQWAGANNPLWILRNNELIEHKADKQPIGKFENRKPFTNHIFHIQKQDVIFLFSDGYADQFGGERGKKFKYSNLKELLLKHASESMEAQCKMFEVEFEKWRGEIEQTDDVCLWAVKI
jgi:serine phosphatase RsbU (regulator of sigma subunit)/ligand-binding sensor domain-containing protein